MRRQHHPGTAYGGSASHTPSSSTPASSVYRPTGGFSLKPISSGVGGGTAVVLLWGFPWFATASHVREHLEKCVLFMTSAAHHATNHPLLLSTPGLLARRAPQASWHAGRCDVAPSVVACNDFVRDCAVRFYEDPIDGRSRGAALVAASGAMGPSDDWLKRIAAVTAKTRSR